ncbi:MAG: SDR family NAD(P)-dependent oxidoreductase [Deltaproteobacteria bacterium]|nr:SDR family NAD(P)-dependent oxidoreductase [Deltaproteobacteria bacterium]MBW2420319.1 SDR family NAD(P)-dependent oxidoreductase [Deltaproteobacteria bacterium]
MQELEGKVAVITGAASGIGRAFAERFAAAGMKLVLADVEKEPLEAVSAALAEGGSEIESAVIDVREPSALAGLAERCEARFGGAHLLCNNAGVGVGGPMWEVTPKDWDWIIGVNLVGVINGIHAFVPSMVASGEPGHVVNTASIAGLTCPAFLGPYNVTKHAVVALSESLLNDFRATGASIGVSVLCPGWVQTRIHESDRNKPAGTPADSSDPNLDAMRKVLGDLVSGGITPQQVAEQVLEAVLDDRFWIRTHPEMEPDVRSRCERIIAAETPKLMAPTEIK